MMSHHTQADILSIEALLNCYLREVALPNQWLSFRHTPRQGYLAELSLTTQQRSLFFFVHSVSITSNYHYLSLPSHQPSGPRLSLSELADLLLVELCYLEHQTDYSELREQVHCSRSVMADILRHSRPGPLSNGVVNAFVQSEQALTVGHRFHPTPKARQGMSETELRAYSPEHGGRFQWHCFSIPLDQHYLTRGKPDLQRFIRDQWMPELPAAADRALLPVHPWQAFFLKKDAQVQQWLAKGLLLDYGAKGLPLVATSSLRTCYHPELDFFVKGSLNLRLTNCVRKNALYELDTAVILSEILHSACEPLKSHGFSIMREPAYQTLNQQGGASRFMVEGFSFIARENPIRNERLGHRPVMAGALFSPRPSDQPLIVEELSAACKQLKTSYFNTALLWFNALLEVMVEPTLRLYFEQGVVLEPHLQNGLVGLKNHLPVHYYYRDLEGTKLLPEHWPEQRLPALSDQARKSLFYDTEKGWQRVCYCLFLNTLAQAVFYISGDDELLERSLWRAVAEHLDDLCSRLPEGRERIQTLLTSAYLPNKANLLVRFRKQADRQANYVMTANPISRAHAERVHHSPLELDEVV